MANPQLENGYTPIANEILDHLMQIHLSPNQWQVLLCIIRKTYGFHKKVDTIANSQIMQVTRLGKTVVSRVLRQLDELQVIDRKSKTVGFQKNWETWELAKSSTTKKLVQQSTLATSLAELPTIEKLAVQSTELAVESTKVSSPRGTQKIKTNTQKKVENESINTKEVEKQSNNHAKAIWDSALNKLKSQVSRSNYRTWFEKSVGLRYQNNQFVIGVSSKYIVAYLQNNQNSLIQRTLMEITDHYLEISYEIIGQK